MSPDDPTRRLESFRHRTLRELEYQLETGHLARDEFERRATLARSAASPLELRPLIADLAIAGGRSVVPGVAPVPSVPPVPPVPPVPRAASHAVASHARARRDEDDSELVVAVMSGSVRDGDWDPPATIHALALMGGAKLDFRDARFATDVVRVHAYAIMGGVTILVPPDVHVSVRGVGLMGGFGRVRRTAPSDGAPRLVIDGFALMGGVDVKVRERGEDDGDERES